jgi:hypothetical protein
MDHRSEHPAPSPALRQYYITQADYCRQQAKETPDGWDIREQYLSAWPPNGMSCDRRRRSRPPQFARFMIDPVTISTSGWNGPNLTVWMKKIIFLLCIKSL